MHVINKAYSEKWVYTDTEFNALYPLSIQALKIPPGFHVVKAEMNDLLKFWIKV
jgi:hypothetical protein